MRESDLQKDVIKHLKKIPKCWYQKNMKTNRNGIPDIVGCIDGKMFAIELKANDKDFRQVSKLQRIELSKINDAGGIGFYANNFKYVKDTLDFFFTEL